MKTSRSPYGVGVATADEHYSKEASLQIVLRESYSASAPDLSSLVTKLKRANADVISHAGYNPDITLFLRQARESGLRFKMLVGAPATASSTSCAPPSARTSTTSATSIRCRRSCSTPRNSRRGWAS